MRYPIILFDADGTLLDSREPIIECHRRTLSHFGITHPDPDDLRRAVGPPVDQTFQEVFHLSPQQAEEARRFYMAIYEEYALPHSLPFDGIRDLLQTLKNWGCSLGIASTKEQAFLTYLMDLQNLSIYFSVIQGANYDLGFTDKGDIIGACLKTLGNPSKGSVLMVGDRKYDLIGAKDNGIDAAGVLYGGTGDRAELEAEPHQALLETVAELSAYLLTGSLGGK